MLLFIPNLLLFWTTNHCLALFCPQDNWLSVSYSGSQHPCHIVLTCSLSLPLSAPCYLWNAKLQEYREIAWSYTMPTAKLPNHCQEIMERPCQRQKAFCHLCHTTYPAQYPAPSSSLINTSMWGWSDDLVYWLIYWHVLLQEVPFFLA